MVGIGENLRRYLQLVERICDNVLVTFLSPHFRISSKHVNFVQEHAVRTIVRAVSRSIVSSTKKSDTPACVIMSTKQGTNTVNLADMRIKYKDKSEIFTEDHLVSKEPIAQFKIWFEEVCNNSQILEPNAMLLGTATRDGVPSVRAVLLKSFGTEGFTFYTNYNSRKGREIAENPHVALTFYWEALRRSVRVEGIAEKTSAENSDHYFQSRPYASQISAVASKQSSVIADRKTLVTKENELLAQFPEGHVKRPDCWGGYLVVPHSIEFWQGQSNRLHDRIRFRRPKANEEINDVLVHEGEDGWVYERLSP